MDKIIVHVHSNHRPISGLIRCCQMLSDSIFLLGMEMMESITNQVRVAFNRKEAASRLGLSVVTIDRELARGNISHFRSGRRVLFTQEHLEEYIRLNERKAEKTS